MECRGKPLNPGPFADHVRHADGENNWGVGGWENLFSDAALVFVRSLELAVC